MKAYRIAILYRYLWKTLVRGIRLMLTILWSTMKTRETPMRSKRSIVIYTTLKNRRNNAPLRRQDKGLVDGAGGTYPERITFDRR